MVGIPVNPRWEPLLIWLGIASLIDFCLVYIDKDRAIHGGWRIQEKTMLIIALIGGWAGLTAGMSLSHNKTEKITFLPIVLGIDGLWFYLLDHATAVLGPPLTAPPASVGAYLAYTIISAWTLAPSTTGPDTPD